MPTSPSKSKTRPLGYYLHFQLEDFEVNFGEQSSVFTGYPLFEEMNKNETAGGALEAGTGKKHIMVR